MLVPATYVSDFKHWTDVERNLFDSVYPQIALISIDETEDRSVRTLAVFAWRLRLRLRIMFAAGEPCRLAALAGSQLYGWKGTCLGGRPGAEVGNFGNLKAGLHFWRTSRSVIDAEAVRRRQLGHSPARAAWLPVSDFRALAAACRKSLFICSE
jgi:hypothetical protein